MSTALVLIAHGSRHPAANDDLHHLAEQMRQRGAYAPVEAAFLELAEPTIDAAGRSCVAQGARQVILVPYFLSAGIHVREDLTEARDLLAAACPDVTFVLAEPLGRHPALVEIVAQRAREAEEIMAGDVEQKTGEREKSRSPAEGGQARLTAT